MSIFMQKQISQKDFMLDRMKTFEPAFRPITVRATTEHSYINTDRYNKTYAFILSEGIEKLMSNIKMKVTLNVNPNQYDFF